MTCDSTFVRTGNVIVGTECCECPRTRNTALCEQCDPTLFGVRTLYYCSQHMKTHKHYRKSVSRTGGTMQ
jgi:hypothetical protein